MATVVLPPYPRLVTELPVIKVNHPDHRSAEAYVKALLQLPLSDPRYAKDEWGTKCNYYGHDCLHVMGYAVPFMRAHEYIKWLRAGPKPFQRMVLHDIVENANMGCPSLAMYPTPTPPAHMMVVLPQEMPTDAGELLIAQAGKVNFYGRQMKYAVGSASVGKVEYYGAP